MHRFFVPPQTIRDDVVRFDPATAHQLHRVLRMRPGQHILVLDNRGFEYDVELVALEKRRAQGRIHARRPATGEPPFRLTLYQALLKKDNFEWVLQKCTEIGVTRFVPVITARTVVSGAKQPRANKWARWQRIIREAAEQSRRGALPELVAPLSFAEALADSQVCDHTLIPWVGEGGIGLRPALASERPAEVPPRLHAGIFIGPEGGFTPDEITQARAAGVVPVTLGPRILRAETAAVAAAVLAVDALSGPRTV